jgi:hypothetical protein
VDFELRHASERHLQSVGVFFDPHGERIGLQLGYGATCFFRSMLAAVTRAPSPGAIDVFT